MKTPWLPLGSSDPLSYTCTCACSTSSPPQAGEVLLFYRYFASPPFLPTSLLTEASPSDLATFHTDLTRSLGLGGKIRVGHEGFNITVGGTSAAIQAYIEACLSHWSFTNLSVFTAEARTEFFKPSPGCACVFSGSPASVRICNEITPMGVTDYAPRDWDVVRELSPGDFHERCLREKVVLVDLRNYYESRIGYFVDGEGREAVRPAVRRFGQWPLWVKSGLLENEEDVRRKEDRKEQQGEGRESMQYLTYCTGGIRCEKGARFLAENLPTTQPSGHSSRVYTLKGGIQAYLLWMDSEIQAGRKAADESLFKGKNYVFDARGSTSLSSAEEGEKVAQCHVCHKAEDRLSKCRSKGCHLILVICKDCKKGNVKCCEDCKKMDELIGGEEQGRKAICQCERERESKLWGGRERKPIKQGRKLGRKSLQSSLGESNGIDIRIQTID